MTPRAARWVSAVAAALLLLGLAGAAYGAGGPVAPTGSVTAGQEVTVDLDQQEVTAGPGEKLTLESTIRNIGSRPLDGYVAHLNILTTDKSVYVDPEDWSPERTQYLEPLAPGEAVTLSWSVRAVTSGPLILFVSVTSPDSDTVTSSGPLDLTVEGQRVVDAGGVMPLVTWMPAGVLALLVATLTRRRRHR